MNIKNENGLPQEVISEGNYLDKLRKLKVEIKKEAYRENIIKYINNRIQEDYEDIVTEENIKEIILKVLRKKKYEDGK